MHDDNTTLSATDLLELNRDLQGTPAIRLLATTNLSLYATLMERHLVGGVTPETELVVRLERDLDELEDPQSGLALIKNWASQGWLHRIVDPRSDQNVCYLTQDARCALDLVRHAPQRHDRHRRLDQRHQPCSCRGACHVELLSMLAQCLRTRVDAGVHAAGGIR